MKTTHFPLIKNGDEIVTVSKDEIMKKATELRDALQQKEEVSFYRLAEERINANSQEDANDLLQSITTEITTKVTTELEKEN